MTRSTDLFTGKHTGLKLDASDVRAEIVAFLRLEAMEHKALHLDRNSSESAQAYHGHYASALMSAADKIEAATIVDTARVAA